MERLKQLYTIGYTQKTAEEFFNTLKNEGITRLIDIRLNNTNIYSKFTAKDDLAFFLRQLTNIEYIENQLFAPTKEMRSKYKQDKNWDSYEEEYLKLLDDRKAIQSIDAQAIDKAVLLCSEPMPDFCHRRLAAEYIAQHITDLEIIHL